MTKRSRQLFVRKLLTCEVSCRNADWYIPFFNKVSDSHRIFTFRVWNIGTSYCEGNISIRSEMKLTGIVTSRPERVIIRRIGMIKQ